LLIDLAGDASFLILAKGDAEVLAARYPSDLTDVQWSKLEPLLKETRGKRHAGGRPRKYALRRVVDALLYVVKTGCQWRQLPADFPPWLSVHQQFRAWRDSGVWERVTKTLRE
jgi:transposase